MNLVGIEKEGNFVWQYNLSEKQADATGKGYSYETDWRGYDPQIGRFRGVDMLAASMPGINPYQYAFNNPVMANDPSGQNPVLIGMAIGAVVGGITGGIIAERNGHNFWNGFAIGAVAGAAVGGGIGYLSGGAGASPGPIGDPWARVADPLAARGANGINASESAFFEMGDFVNGDFDIYPNSKIEFTKKTSGGLKYFLSTADGEFGKIELGTDVTHGFSRFPKNRVFAVG